MSVFNGNVIRNEPALIVGLVQAIVALVVAFGIDLSEEQVGSILAITAVILSIVTRMLVSPATPAAEGGSDAPGHLD